MLEHDQVHGLYREVAYNVMNNLVIGIKINITKSESMASLDSNYDMDSFFMLVSNCWKTEKPCIPVNNNIFQMGLIFSFPWALLPSSNIPAYPPMDIIVVLLLQHWFVTPFFVCESHKFTTCM